MHAADDARGTTPPPSPVPSTPIPPWRLSSALSVLAMTILSVAPPAHQPSARWAKAQVRGSILDRRLDEASGLAIDPLQPQHLWSHNDSGDRPLLYMLDLRGQLLTQIKLDGAPHYDYEDLAIGPCTPQEPSRRCLFIADIGDNRHKRAQVQLYRAPIPTIKTPAPPKLHLQIEHTEHISYPQGPHDAETLLIHPKTGQRWIVFKSRRGDSSVVELPDGPSSPAKPKRAKLVKTLSIKGPSLGSRLITSGAISPDGQCIALRTYTQLLTYCAPQGRPLIEAFDHPPDLYIPPPMLQAEALTFDPHTGGLWLTSERWPAPLVYITPSKPPKQTP
jgi:hypothetical protein